MALNPRTGGGAASAAAPSASRRGRRWLIVVALLLAVTAAGRAAAVAAAAPPGWWDPLPLSTATGTSPDVAVSPAGDVVAAWTQIEGDRHVVQAAVRPAGGTFGPAVDVSASDEDAYDVDVAIDDAGDAIVVWTGDDGTHARARAASRPAGGAFAEPVDLSDEGRDVSTVRVATDAAGDVVAAWVASDGTSKLVQAAARAAGADAFAAPEDLSLTDPDTQGVSVAANHDGDAIVVWSRAGVLQAASRVAGASFGDAEELTLPFEDGQPAGVGIADDGTAVVAWQRVAWAGGQPAVTMRAAIREGNGTFGAPVDLSADPAAAAGLARVVVGRDGRAIVVWEQFTDTTDHAVLRVAERAPGSAFGATADLDPNCWTPAATLDAAGGATVLCRKVTTGGMTTQAFARSADGAVSGPVTINGPEEGYAAVAASDAAGDVVAVWQGDVIRAAVRDVGAPVLSGVTVPATATVGTPTTISAAATDAWGAPAITVDFGDGQSAAGPAASHVYVAPGTYEVTVMATDGAGNVAVQRRAIAVTVGSSPAARDGGGTPPSGGAPGSGNGANPGDTHTGTKLAFRPVPASPPTRIRTVLRHAPRVSFSIGAAGRLVIRWTARARVRGRLRSVVVARGSAVTPGTGTVEVRLTARGRALLAHVRRIVVTATATFRPAGGGAPTRRTARLILTR